MTHVKRLTALVSLLGLVIVAACGEDDEGGGPADGAAGSGGEGADVGQGGTGGAGTGGGTTGGTGGSGTGGSAGETGQGGTGGSAGETGQGGTGGSAGETGQGGTTGGGGEPAQGGAAGDGGSGPTIYPNVDCLDPGMWFDETSGLCWEDDASTDGFQWSEAGPHCASLTLGGFTWVLPDIDQLRSLIRLDNCTTDCGCAANVPGGACGLTAQDPPCLSLLTCRDDCGLCPMDAGPGIDGCYFSPELGGACSMYWSSTQRADTGGYDYLTVTFFDGGVNSRPDYEYIANLVRCVRDDS